MQDIVAVDPDKSLETSVNDQLKLSHNVLAFSYIGLVSVGSCVLLKAPILGYFLTFNYGQLYPQWLIEIQEISFC